MHAARPDARTSDAAYSVRLHRLAADQGLAGTQFNLESGVPKETTLYRLVPSPPMITPGHTARKDWVRCIYDMCDDEVARDPASGNALIQTALEYIRQNSSGPSSPTADSDSEVPLYDSGNDSPLAVSFMSDYSVGNVYPPAAPPCTPVA
jgi:hypothetical protein